MKAGANLGSNVENYLVGGTGDKALGGGSGQILPINYDTL